MRSIANKAAGDEVIYLDGVKNWSTPAGWTLIVPDQDEPITRAVFAAESDDPSGIRASGRQKRLTN